MSARYCAASGCHTTIGQDRMFCGRCWRKSCKGTSDPKSWGGYGLKVPDWVADFMNRTVVLKRPVRAELPEVSHG